MNSTTVEISDPAALAQTPLVSVIMLAYRHEKYIAQAIAGVVAQQCAFPFELIIGEDCSPDRTKEIVLDHQRRYPHIVRVLSSGKNVGMQANAKRCTEAARGKFNAGCEGDDFWCDPTKLARQVAIFERYPDCVLVFHAAKTLDAKTGREGVTGRRSFRSRFMDADEIIRGDGGFMPSASLMMRRVPLIAAPPWVFNAVVPDYATALWAICSGRIAYIDRMMSVWRTNMAESWTGRHAPNLAYRMEHARKIEVMFTAFLESCSGAYRPAAAHIVSKYYSDALIRVPPSDGTEIERYFSEASTKMVGSDRVLAWLAARHGLRLPKLKTLLRKVGSLFRLIYSLLTSERIDA